MTKTIARTPTRIARPLLAALLAASSGTLLAQAASDQGLPPAPPGQAATSIDPDTLDSFVDAFVEVRQISEQFEPRVQAADDQQAAHELQMQAQEEMIEAVREHDMTIAEYNELVNAMRMDPALLQQVTEKAAARQ
ncbi:MAG: DUF4168 domain-containing protein [Chromatiaceae bacterium]|nr:MAG: DUF4168 domain-containing protein [Chromatiaceae bacterium]